MKSQKIKATNNNRKWEEKRPQIARERKRRNVCGPIAREEKDLV